MNDERRAELRRLADAATSGPWRWDDDDGYIRTTEPHANDSVAMGEPTHEGNHRIAIDPDDGDFIAAARTAVPELLAECERLRAALTDACDFWQAHLDGFVKRTGGDGGSRSEQAHLDRLRAKGQP